MILNSTKYKNPERTIIGTPVPVVNQVSTADTIILCDTSGGAIILQLLEIPNDQWNTTYKVYIADKTNNASVNNITINAPVGFTINNQPSLVISNNGGSVLIRVASNTGYLGSLNFSTGSVSVVNRQNPFAVPVTLTTALDTLDISGFQTTAIGNDVYLQNAFVKIDTIQLSYLITNSLLISNQIYQVGGVVFGNSPDPFRVYVKATSNNTLDTYGTGLFYNADYMNSGNYSSVVGFVAQLGIWSSSLVVVTGDVVIWNNYHYKNLTGVNTANNPFLDGVNWKIISYSITTGYILEYNLVGLYFNAGLRIGWRKDQYANYVEDFTDLTTSLNALNRFQWGNLKCNQNVVSGTAIFDNCNVIFPNSKALSNNSVRNVRLYLTNNIDPSTFGFFQSNDFINCQRTLKIYGNSIDCEFRNNSYTNTAGGIPLFFLKGTSVFSFNIFVNSGLSGTIENCFVQGNYFTQANVQLIKQGGSTINNTISGGQLIINAGSGNESGNIIVKGGGITAMINDGSIDRNYIQNGSSIIIENNSISGIIQKNTLDNNSFLGVSIVNNGIIGDGGVKGESNLLQNSTNFDMQTIPVGRQIFRNSFIGCEIQISLFDGGMSNCIMSNTEITLASMNSHTLVGLNLTLAGLGTGGYILPQTFSLGQFIKGNGSIKAFLDCSDIAIYDLPNQTLTIPSTLGGFAGIFELTNASGITINKIVNLSDQFATTILNNSGATSFNITGVGVAVANEIIGDAGTPPVVTINFRLNGTDSIFIQRNGFLNGLIKQNIYI